MPIAGGCRCGECRYELDYPTLPAIYACHCGQCQTQTGGGFVLQAMIPAGRMRVTGERVDRSRPNSRGAVTTQTFCAQCLRVCFESRRRATLCHPPPRTPGPSAHLRYPVGGWAGGAGRWVALSKQTLTRLYNTNEARPGVVLVRAGTLDASATVVPAVHMWASRRQPWIGLPADAEIYDEAIPIARVQQIFASNFV